MKITRQEVSQKLIDYLYHNIKLEELVDWAESVMMEEDFEKKDYKNLRNIISRIGLADIRAFGISWEDCENFLDKLGYEVNITINQRPA